jgi:glutathione S-transferase
MADATSLILHHFKSSPFSEKIRLVFGLKGLNWVSVDIPNIMPKPDLTPLTGGYRRTPVMQIGADIYCDTQLILREIERRHPAPSLYPNGEQGLAWMVSMWADKSFFQANVPVIFGAEGFTVSEAFKQDRTQLSGRPFDTEQMRAAAPMMRDQWRGHAAWVEEALSGGKDWLLGDKAGLADIAAHMNFWFLRKAYRPGYDGLMASFPKTAAWVERVNAIGHGTSEIISSSDALALATSSDPTSRTGVDPQEPQGLNEGDYVSIAPDDYGRDPVSGTLVFSDAFEIAIKRDVEGLGSVVVHFPRVGFTVRRS